MCSYTDKNLYYIDDNPEHGYVRQTGQQNMSEATVEDHGMIQQGRKSMLYCCCAWQMPFMSHLVTRLFSDICLLF